jgi:multidrug efflux pump subunit AcrB
MQSNKGVIAWFIHNPVAANLLLAAILILGWLALGIVRTEFMPKPESNILHVGVQYPGASPKEVELGITLKVEDALRNVAGIRKITSTSSARVSRTNIEVEDGFDPDEVLDRIKVAVDNINTFPNDVEDIVVTKPVGTELSIQVAIYGLLDEEQAKLLAEEIKRDMLSSTIVKNINIWGTRPFEISVEINKEQLERYNLTLRQVADRIRAESVNLPSGSVKSDSGTYAIRVEGQAYQQQDFEKIVLLTSEDGRQVYLGDIASVRDDFVSWGADAFFDGKYTVGLAVSAVGDQDSIAVANAVKRYVKEKQKELPEGVYLQEWADITYYLDSRLTMMAENMLFGAALVFLVLAAFMELKIAFWVMAGLPVCYFGAFIVMPFSAVDVSINMVSLFGFILVLGIIVDDAIVVAESVSTETKANGFSKESVLAGTKKVALPSIFGVCTTIVAFMPTLFLEGPYRLMPYSVGAVVCLALIFSLIESKWILPSHLADMNSPIWRFLKSERQQRWQTHNNQRLQTFVDNKYLPLLKAAIAHRYSTVASFIALFVVSLALLANGVVRYELLPALPHDFLQVSLRMGDGTSEERTREVMQNIADSIIHVNEAYKEEFDTEAGLIEHMGRNNTSETSGTFFLELTKDEDRELNSFEIIERWRKQVGEIPDAARAEFTAFRGSGGSKNMSFLLVSSNKEQLRQASEELSNELKTFDGLYDVHSSVEGQNLEYVLKLKPKAMALGLTLGEISIQVREAFFGAEAQRFQRGNEEVKVMVRYPEEKRTLVDLENMNIKTRDGRFIPLKELANIELGYAESSILRVNGQASATVSAKVGEKSIGSGNIAKQIKQEFFPELFQRYPDVSYKSDGASLEQEKIEGDVALYFLISLLAVFILLAIPLQSYFQPVIIMSAIPFGIVGAIFGHLLFGFPISLMSLFGIIALSGVVVNDSLLMVDFVNRAVSEGKSLDEAAFTAGSKRFRAIMLTTVTTFVGLLPMLLESSLQAESMIPMAISLGFGIIFATTITLILVPCLYMVLEDFKKLANKVASRLGLAHE